jgi:hypothetical protein
MTRSLPHLPGERQTPVTAMCDHLHDTTSRYDAAKKLLTFLRVCPTCGIEQVVETLDYEPRPLWAFGEAAPRLAVLPVESSIPPDTTLDEWRHRKLAA